MRYSVKCSKCKQVFVIEPQAYGRQKCRCPYCGGVFTCLIKPAGNKETPVRQAGASRQPVQLTAADEQQTQLTEKQAQQSEKRRGFWKTLWNGMKWLWEHVSVFLIWSGKRIRMFRDKYEDADLWLFHGFSLLFVGLVVGGLVVAAQCAKLIAVGQSWVFKVYLQVVHILS